MILIRLIQFETGIYRDLRFSNIIQVISIHKDHVKIKLLFAGPEYSSMQTHGDTFKYPKTYTKGRFEKLE
jgi:hypothetical protein